MKRSIELPLAEPFYNTYHIQGADSAVFAENPSICNWYYNHLSMLYCNKKFLRGHTTPELFIWDSSFENNPYLKKMYMPIKYFGYSVHKVIRELLDDQYYVHFYGIDDFYIKGKTWYQKRHFIHDGLLYGYDQNDRTYSIYAYDQSWRYRTYKISQDDFEAGRKSARDRKVAGKLFAIKPIPTVIELKPDMIFENIRDYLGYSSRKEYLKQRDKTVFGIETQEYMAMYLTMLASGDIPYEKMDWRIFRQLWEHKKVMQKRIAAVEQRLSVPLTVSEQYSEVVKQANDIRMLYAAHHMKRKDSVLPVMRKKLLAVAEMEFQLLCKFLELDK